MATDSEQTALEKRFDFINEEIKGLNAMETWGASLFLTAIALIAKQLIDWSAPATSGSSAPPVLQWQIFLTPAVLGLVAFLFLRSVNYRIRRVRRHQYALSGATKDRRWSSWGIVGWFMAGMPLGAGLLCTWYFSLSHPQVSSNISTLALVSGVAVLGALVVFIRQSAKQ